MGLGASVGTCELLLILHAPPPPPPGKRGRGFQDYELRATSACPLRRLVPPPQQQVDIHEIEERKNLHINDLMRNHEKAFGQMKAYYNDITNDNLKVHRRGGGGEGMPGDSKKNLFSPYHAVVVAAEYLRAHDTYQ